MVLGRILLFIFGFFNIKTTKLSPVSNPPSLTSVRKLVVSNHVSWIDFIYTATFVTPHVILSNQDGNVILTTPLIAIYYTLTKFPFSSKDGLIKLLNKSMVSPLIIFPESTTSNGKALLKFSSVFEGVG
jgi:1-acyl-sn-glycerol-3-phosphate acyltransferase